MASASLSHHQGWFLVGIELNHTTKAVVKEQVKLELSACIWVAKYNSSQSHRTVALIDTEIQCWSTSFTKPTCYLKCKAK